MLGVHSPWWVQRYPDLVHPPGSTWAAVVGDHDRAVQWKVSGNDLQEHGFYLGQRPDTWEALCTHSVPAAKVVDQGTSVLRVKRCISCLLVHGDDLANNGGDPGEQGRTIGGLDPDA